MFDANHKKLKDMHTNYLLHLGSFWYYRTRQTQSGYLLYTDLDNERLILDIYNVTAIYHPESVIAPMKGQLRNNSSN